MSLPVQPTQGSSSDVQEHIVRMPRERKKKYTIMKIGNGIDLDFTKLHQAQTSVRIERENNFKEYKTAYDIDTQPKFGAGSEFGREQKEEARRKKYGIRKKNYNPEDQPWMLKVGQGKNLKKFKGVREGTISDNTSYYIFTKCSDGAFEATPVEEWYNYTAQIRYKFLNSEEAEEEFSRRDKTLNFFNIMVKKRMRRDEAGEADEETREKASKDKTKNRKGFKLTDMEDSDGMSDEDEREDDDDEDGKDNDDSVKKPKKKGKGKARVRATKNSKHNSDDEAIEESDEGDYDDREVDYMTDSGDSSDGGPEEKGDKKDKYEEKGVDEEEGLRKIIDSCDEDEDDEDNKDDDNDDEKDKGKKNGIGSDSDSTSSSSGSESDIEKDDKIASALFMQKGQYSEKKQRETASPKPDEKAGMKRKLETEITGVKKARTDSPLPTQGGGASIDGITEDSIRRYLMRKPMTTKDLLQKFRSKKLNLSNEQMTHSIAQLLKRINPDKKIINKVMYLSIKSD